MGGAFPLLGATPDVTAARVGTSTEVDVDVLEWLQWGVPVSDSGLRGDSATACEESSDVPRLLGEQTPRSVSLCRSRVTSPSFSSNNLS